MQNPTRSRWGLALSLCGLLLFAGSAAGLVNGEAPAEDDTRFDAVAAFSQTKWLMPNEEGRGGHNWFGAGVLIAPDVVLIAQHLLPTQVIQGKNKAADRYMVRFRRHAEGGLGSHRGGHTSYHQVPVHTWIMSPDRDLALGILSKPVEHIEPVKLLLDQDAEVAGQRLMLAGWGSESPWRGEPKPRIGLKIGENTATRLGTSLRVDSYKTEMREMEDGKRGTYIIDENAVPNMHDSGGSMFLFDADGQPILAGIISRYSGGVFLPAANSDEFPLDAAAKGGRELLKALKEKRVDEGE